PLIAKPLAHRLPPTATRSSPRRSRDGPRPRLCDEEPRPLPWIAPLAFANPRPPSSVRYPPGSIPFALAPDPHAAPSRIILPGPTLTSLAGSATKVSLYNGFGFAVPSRANAAIEPEDCIDRFASTRVPSAKVVRDRLASRSIARSDKDRFQVERRARSVPFGVRRLPLFGHPCRGRSRDLRPRARARRSDHRVSRPQHRRRRG